MSDQTKSTISPAAVSVIIPCRNEEKFIAACLDSLCKQTYPKESLEVLVVDGFSKDGTRGITKSYQERYSWIKLFDNPKKHTPSAFNIGIANANGGIIILMGAHASYPNDYIAKCVGYLHTTPADVVGGNLRTVAHSATAPARAIAEVLHHPLGVGGSRFRMGSGTTQWVDAVFGGCYRKEIFSEIGMFNENLIRSQDMEFFIRLKRAGKKILLAPDIECTYYPKQTVKNFLVHNIRDGIWAIYPLKFVHAPLRLRHYIPLLFIASALGLGIASILWAPLTPLFIICSFLYGLIVVSASCAIAIKKRDPMLFVPLIGAFMARHFGYGVGSLIGVLKLLIPSKHI